MVFNSPYHGRDCTMDISVINPASKSKIQEASTTQKYSLFYCEEQKKRKYQKNCEELNIQFLPVVWEVFGMPSDTFCDIFSKLVKSISSISKIEPSSFILIGKKDFHLLYSFITPEFLLTESI